MRAFQRKVIFLIFTLIPIGLLAQTQKLKRVNTFFENQEYPMAVRGYEDLLSNSKIPTAERKEIMINLAYSYKKLQDYGNSERIYRDLFRNYEKELKPIEYLNFAQVLAGNAKYRESQRYFSKYGEYQKQDLRAGKYTMAYMDKSHFYKDSAMYKIQYMDKLNSRYSDFAPMYYENGLVYVTAKNEGTIIKRVFSQDETPFLDLYLYPDSTLTFIPDSLDLGEDVFLNMESSISYQPADKEWATPANTRNDIDPVPFSRKLNSKYHEGPVTFTKDFKKIIFTRNNYYKGKAGKGDNGFNMLKLYMAEKKGNKWINIQELPFNSNNFSIGHPALSPENHRLYFVSDMPGGYGGTDIYSIDYINGEWGQPINLGSTVNTEGDEMFPYADQYGNLYFASDGHAGLGGLDIFYVEMRNGIPSGEIENLGAPINSEKDDFGLITDGRRQTGFFSSNRKRGYSDDNLYSFVRGCNQLNIRIFDEDNVTPLADAEVRLIKNGINRDRFTTDSKGIANVCLEPGTDFYFKIFKEGYDAATLTYGTFSGSISKNQTIILNLNPTVYPMVRGRVISEFNHLPIVAAQVTLENTDDGSFEIVTTGLDGRYAFQPQKEGNYIVKTIKENAIASNKITQSEWDEEDQIEMVSIGDLLRLDNINYDYGKYTINQRGKNELREKVLPFLTEHPTVIIELRSHTDSRSSAEFNLKLSQKRAEEVKKYLVSLGVDEDRILARGYGKSELLNECDDFTDCTAVQHRQNRRTEIKILEVENFATR